jgi:hypothetical protein
VTRPTNYGADAPESQVNPPGSVPAQRVGYRRADRPDLDLERLCSAIERSRQSLESFRRERREAVRDYVGSHYSDEGSGVEVPVNLLDLYVTIVGRTLIAKEPRYKFSTFSRENRPAVKAMESWANRQVVKMGLADTLRRAALDALFSVGIVKVCLAPPSAAHASGYSVAAGTPYVDLVDLDDFVFDVKARCFAEASYAGHRLRVPIETVRDDRRYNKNRKALTPQEDRLYDEAGNERTDRMTAGYGSYGDGADYLQYVDLWEIYLPHRKSVVTLRSGEDGRPDPGFGVLLEEEWVGPDCGPYHYLGLKAVPGNAMPKGPVGDLLDLHRFVNKLYRKLFRQADRQKTLTGVSGNSDEDAKRITESPDGTAVRVDRPEGVKEVNFGGPNPTVFAVAQQFAQVFSYQAGNLDSMGGLSAQAKTATQDQMLASNASKTVGDMQETMVTFVAGVGESLGWFWWHDPFKVQKTTYSPDGSPDIAIVREVYPDNPRVHGNVPGLLVRKGRWDEVDVRVDPYSIAHKTPEQRLATLMQVVQQVILPAMPILQQQGIAFDANAFLAAVSELGDMPDLMDIVSIVEPPKQDSSTGGGEDPKMPSATNRTYTRENVAMRTPQGDRQNQINALLKIPTGGNQDRQGNARMPG